MASPAIDVSIEIPLDTVESDYGSDFSPEEEEIVAQLLSTQHSRDDNPIISNVERDEPQRVLRFPKILGRAESSLLFRMARAADQEAEQISKAIDQCNQSTKVVKGVTESKPRAREETSIENSENLEGEATPSEDTIAKLDVEDTRSPLERFRTAPNKTLSVSDLVAPAWCELQYWYTLRTPSGKKKRTKEMKKGTKVHEKLEAQVHTTVKVEVATKEDAFGLRIWNVIQGLRTLRATGQTRELEVWGTIDGLVVNGVIDELNYICPDAEFGGYPDLEDTLQPPTITNYASANQPTISEFFKATGGSTLKEAAKAITQHRVQTNKVYLCDVKTRSVKSLPSGPSMRPTKMQLMLYHKLLSDLATNAVDFSVLSDRYRLDQTRIFSDSLIAQIGSLNEEYDALSEPARSQESEPSWSQDSLSQLLAHNNLELLWSYMIEEFQQTIPYGVNSLGEVLKVEYRSQTSGEIIGFKTFSMSDKDLKAYINHEMEWWRGTRKAEGVIVEEAYKCRSCDFAETCEWRLEKIEEAKQNARTARKDRRKISN
ncbi:exonuclease V a 5' deoxyribonuclease-domain-containing protein [Tricladium varicosporioides]|nr:exonuclease V a 5' deoxyribonuclease-domain-containing protein [Hymenoscyphus varicosporioides]